MNGFAPALPEAPLPDLVLYDTEAELAAAATENGWCTIKEFTVAFYRYVAEEAFTPANSDALLAAALHGRKVCVGPERYSFYSDGRLVGPGMVYPLTMHILVLAENSRRGIRTLVSPALGEYWREVQVYLPCPLLLAADKRSARGLWFCLPRRPAPEKPRSTDLRLTYHCKTRKVTAGRLEAITSDKKLCTVDILPRLLAAADTAMKNRRRGTGRTHAAPLRIPADLDLADWKIDDRRQTQYTAPDSAVRNPWALYVFHGTDGSYTFQMRGLPKYPDYWEILSGVLSDAANNYSTVTGIVAQTDNDPLRRPEETFQRCCYGFWINGIDNMLILTENYSALEMFREALAQGASAGMTCEED